MLDLQERIFWAVSYTHLDVYKRQIWNRLQAPVAAAAGAKLASIRVYETTDIFAEYRGE